MNISCPSYYRVMATKSTPVTCSGHTFNFYYTDLDPTMYPFPVNGAWHAVLGDEFISGSSNPLWRDQILRGQNASTPYQRHGYDVVPAYLSCVSSLRHSPTYLDTLHGDYSGFVNGGLSVSTSAGSEDAVVRDKAIGRLRNRLGNESQSFNALVPLGEIHELRALLSHGHGSVVGACTDIVQQLIKIKRGIANPRRAFKAAQNAWLTWSFGIKPTLSDVSAIGNSIAAYFNKPERNVVITGSATSEWHDSVGFGSLPGNYGFTVGGVQALKKRVSYKYICGHRFKTSASKDYSLLDQLGFNIPNLIPTAWESIPYSWIVDYFSTAGQFLEDTFTSVSGESIYVIENRKFEVEARVSVFPVPTPSPDISVYTRSARDGYVRYYEFSRTPQSSIPARSLRLKSLDEIGINGVNRLLNLTALLRF